MALSLLRRLRRDISFCKAVAILVKVRIWCESVSADSCDFTTADELFVTLANGFGMSVEGAASLDDVDGMF